MNYDWRLQNQKKYLFQKELRLQEFCHTDLNDHEHCEFCMSKFSENPEDLHWGYATLNGYYWICSACFNDFRDTFEWKVHKTGEHKTGEHKTGEHKTGDGSKPLKK